MCGLVAPACLRADPTFHLDYHRCNAVCALASKAAADTGVVPRHVSLCHQPQLLPTRVCRFPRLAAMLGLCVPVANHRHNTWIAVQAACYRPSVIYSLVALQQVTAVRLP